MSQEMSLKAAGVICLVGLTLESCWRCWSGAGAGRYSLCTGPGHGPEPADSGPERGWRTWPYTRAGMRRPPQEARQVLDEISQRAQGHQAERAQRPEDGEDGEAVRRSPEGGVSVQPLHSEADPHGGQHQGDEDGRGGYPSEVVAEAATAVVPAAEVRVDGRGAGEAVDGVDAEPGAAGRWRGRREVALSGICRPATCLVSFVFVCR